jgi:hypothetical protein
MADAGTYEYEPLRKPATQGEGGRALRGNVNALPAGIRERRPNKLISNKYLQAPAETGPRIL